MRNAVFLQCSCWLGVAGLIYRAAYLWRGLGVSLRRSPSTPDLFSLRRFFPSMGLFTTALARPAGVWRRRKKEKKRKKKSSNQCITSIKQPHARRGGEQSLAWRRSRRRGAYRAADGGFIRFWPGVTSRLRHKAWRPSQHGARWIIEWKERFIYLFISPLSNSLYVCTHNANVTAQIKKGGKKRKRKGWSSSPRFHRANKRPIIQLQPTAASRLSRPRGNCEDFEGPRCYVGLFFLLEGFSVKTKLLRWRLQDRRQAAVVWLKMCCKNNKQTKNI